MIKVGIVGGTGYTGAELLRCLSEHPRVQLTVITSRSEAGIPVSELFQNLRGKTQLCFSTPDVERFVACDLLFFATPNGTAMGMVRELLEAGVRIIDLAADFRLKDPAQWQHWYGSAHTCPDLLGSAVYGLPELNREAIRTARLASGMRPAR